jgi:hypothetical protein
MKQSLFVNRQSASTAAQMPIKENKGDVSHPVQEVAQAKKTKAPIEGEFIKIVEHASFDQAENLFEHANQYAKMTNNAQNGLQAYTAIDTQNKRNALRDLMGVDLYA